MKKMKLCIAIALWSVVLGIGALAFWAASPNPKVTKSHPTADTSLEGTFRGLGAGLGDGFTGAITPRSGK